jgi:hypothetical protein
VENRLLKKKENSTKSKLAHQLEVEATNTPLLGPFDKSSSVFIRDDMALLQEFSFFFKSLFSTEYAQCNVCRRVIGLFVQQRNP